MTLQQIKYAISIAETGSMNKSAEQMAVSQPTLTSAVKELEKEAGITIFFRNSRGVVLTPEGEEFLRYAREVYQQFDLLESKYSNKANIKRKFGVSSQHYSFVAKAFVETVRQFGTLNYEFAIRETKTAEVISDVGDMRSEIGVVYLSDYNRKIVDKLIRDNELEFSRLIDCKAYVYLWKGHPLAKKRSISLEELQDYPCLMFEQGTGSSSFLAEEILTEKNYSRIIRTTDRATNLNLMIGLNAYTICSGIICEELNGSDYVAVPFEEDEDNRNSIMEIGYLKRKGHELSEIAIVLLGEMKRYLEGTKRTFDV